MGADGLREATAVAILIANYIARKLAPHFPVLYTSHGGFVAHECIIDVRPIKERCGISNMDVAKRLVDYGFHAPTVSFPLVNAPHTVETLLVEDWNHAYTREQAAYPLASLGGNKYWPPVGCVDDVYGNRNIMCTCPPLESYANA